MAQTNASPTPAAFLGALVSIGGIIGYSRTGSIPSIAAGLLVGSIYLYSYSLQKRAAPYGIETALLASVILGGSSIPRAIKLGKPVPSALAVLSIFGMGYYGARYFGR